MYSNVGYINGRSSEYSRKKITDWYGDDCLEWASDAERELNIPLSSWVSIDGFQKVTGRDLLRYSSRDFRKLVNDEYGPLFFKLFRKMVKERREDKASTKSPVQNFDLDISENTTWTVPQLDLPSDLDMPLTDNGNSYSNSDLSSPFDSYQNSRSCLSPEFGGPSSYGGTSFSYGGLSPSYGGVSPTFGASPSSLDIYDRDGCSRASTYFTQPSMLSGGSISYGTSENTQDHRDNIQDASNSSFDSSFQGPSSYGAYSSLLPDFNSLMIEDRLASSSPNELDIDIDINELDASFKEETFSDLDQYIHSENSGPNTDFEKLNEVQENFSMQESSVSTLISSDQGSLEECMLKKITTGKRGNRVRHPQSWEFLVRLLMNPKSNPSLIKWEDKKNGIFRLVQKEEIAKLWGKRSQKHKDEPLAYDNFARILRYHYRSKILLPVSDKHLVYKLGDKILENLKSQGLLQV